MKVAVIGACGWAGQRHLAAFRALGANVSHIVDHHPDRVDVATRNGAVAVQHYHDILDIAFDAVSIALPPSQQPDICKAFLGRGVSVLCEKPVAMNVRQAEDIREFVGGVSDAVFMPAFLLRFHPVFLRMRELIQSGELGRINELRIDGRVKRTSITGWRLDHDMGGVSLVNAIHMFDLARWFLGEIDPPVFATIGNWHFDIPTEDWMDSILYSARGTRIQLRSAWWPFHEEDFCALDIDGWVLRLRLEGELGTLVLTQDGYLHVRPSATTSVRMEMGIDLFQAETAHFLDAVKRKTTPHITVEDNLAAQRLVEQTKIRATQRH
jgi:predicted dehydrogenase